MTWEFLYKYARNMEGPEQHDQHVWDWYFHRALGDASDLDNLNLHLTDKVGKKRVEKFSSKK